MIDDFYSFYYTFLLLQKSIKKRARKKDTPLLRDGSLICDFNRLKQITNPNNQNLIAKHFRINKAHAETPEPYQDRNHQKSIYQALSGSSKEIADVPICLPHCLVQDLQLPVS